MHYNKFIVADASPLIGLSKINQLDLLNKLFSEVILPEQVAKECTENLNKPGALLIYAAIKNKSLKVKIIDIKKNSFSIIIDAGEIAAIELAKKLECPILLDEKQGRLVAKSYGLKVIGLGGLLVFAKERKLIKKVKPLLDELENARYFLGKQVIAEILSLAKE